MKKKTSMPDESGAAHGCAFAPLHPARLAHPLEGTLRREWERYVSERPGFDILSGPEVHFLDVPPGVEADENKITGGYQPYPYGRMNDRDKMLAAELIQWLGSPLGFAFLATAFERAGGRVTFDDYKHNAQISGGIPSAEFGCSAWNDCSDTLPSDMESVLVVSRQNKCAVMHREREVWVYAGATAMWQPTHWMLLPRTPNSDDI